MSNLAGVLHAIIEKCARNFFTEAEKEDLHQLAEDAVADLHARIDAAASTGSILPPGPPSQDPPDTTDATTGEQTEAVA